MLQLDKSLTLFQMADDVMFRDATGREVTYGRAMFSYVLVIVTIFGGIIFTIIGINNG